MTVLREGGTATAKFRRTIFRAVDKWAVHTLPYSTTRGHAGIMPVPVNAVGLTHTCLLTYFT